MGGAERQLYKLLKGINREMFNPIVISLSQGGDWADELRQLEIQVVEIPRKRNKEFARLFKLIKLLKEIKPNIVHTFLFSANTYGRLASIITRVPIVIASERSLPDVGKDKSTFNMYVDKVLAFFSHAIICNSLKASEVLIKKYSFNPKRIITIYNGISCDAFTVLSTSQNQKIARKVIGTVGSLYPIKNHKLFLDVAKIVIESYVDKSIKFLIIGKGPLRKDLFEYAQKLRIADSVVFAGERKDIPELLKNIDVFVMTSLHEGMSNAIMEAMIAGLPVVTTDVGGNSELVIEKKTGFMFPPNDASGLADKVTWLLNNESEAMQMGEIGKQRMLKEFGVERMIKETETTYLKLFKKYNRNYMIPKNS